MFHTIIYNLVAVYFPVKCLIVTLGYQILTIMIICLGEVFSLDIYYLFVCPGSVE